MPEILILPTRGKQQAPLRSLMYMLLASKVRVLTYTNILHE